MPDETVATNASNNFDPAVYMHELRAGCTTIGRSIEIWQCYMGKFIRSNTHILLRTYNVCVCKCTFIVIRQTKIYLNTYKT